MMTLFPGIIARNSRRIYIASGHIFELVAREFLKGWLTSQMFFS